MNPCPEHEKVVTQAERTATLLAVLQSDITEVKCDVKKLLIGNGDRREAFGEVKGKLFMLVTLISLATSAVAVVVAEIILRAK